MINARAIPGTRSSLSSTTDAPRLVRDVLRSEVKPIDAVRRCRTDSRFGHDFSRVRVQPELQPVTQPPPAPARLQAKLAVNVPGDRYEQEADRVAEAVLRAGPQKVDAPSVSHCPHCERIQRVCDECEEERRRKDETVHAKEAPGRSPQLSPESESQVAAVRGGGRPLPETVREFFEPHFGYDFSQVRVHTGARAAEAAGGIGALAYTLGRDIVFNQGQYAPETWSGKRLLAHELAHVVQQS